MAQTSIFKCGNCGHGNVEEHNGQFGWIKGKIRMAFCPGCRKVGTIKASGEWQGLQEEARALMYARQRAVRGEER
jgi:hypothetical protein